MAPKGPDEGGYRWVQWPSNGRMGTSAPTPGYDRFRRGRCPQRPVDNGPPSVVPLIRHGCAMPPSPLRGEGYSRSVGSAQMSMAFPSSVTACAVPPSPRGRLWGRGDGLPRRGFAPPRNDSTGGRKDPPLRGFSPILPNSTKRAIISSAHGYALALPVFGRREAPSSGGGRTSLFLLHYIGGG